ncbi:MAG: hypothetical protein JXR37_27885 [Kiritimatiellae bacterium]|nr:hypothetical protein [Kiritimatiellia bacterium]
MKHHAVPLPAHAEATELNAAPADRAARAEHKPIPVGVGRVLRIALAIGMFGASARADVLRACWAKRYDAGWPTCLRQARDGGWFIGGRAAEGALLLATDKAGRELWRKHYGESGPRIVSEVVLIKEHANGLVLVGNTFDYTSPDPSSYRCRPWLIRTDRAGTQPRTQTYPYSGYDVVLDARCTNDGGFILCGASDGAGWLLKLTAHGSVTWSRRLDPDIWPVSVAELNEGGYALAGYRTVTKTDPWGSIVWTRRYDSGCMYRIEQIRAGGFVLVGTDHEAGQPNESVCVRRLDTQGDLLWARILGGWDCDAGYSVQQAADGGFLVGGYSESFAPADHTGWLFKTDANGDLTWSYFPGTDGPIRQIEPTAGRGFAVLAQDGDDVFLMEMDDPPPRCAKPGQGRRRTR